MARYLKAVVTSALLVGALLALRTAWEVTASNVPSYQSIKKSYRSSETVLLDRNNEPIQSSRVDFTARRLPWLENEAIPEKFQELLLRSEDRRFYTHHGVDWLALLGNIPRSLTGRPRGASTISMQLAKLVLPTERHGASRLTRKVCQIKNALLLESSWTKKEILTAYLNLVPVRGEIRGLSAATFSLFHKAPHGLEQDESAMLIALLRSPNADYTATARRACRLLSTPQETNCEARVTDKIASSAGSLSANNFFSENIAPHALRQRISDLSGKPLSATIPSTLDLGIQRAALEILQSSLEPLRERRVYDGALIVIDNKSGDILAYVGNSGEKASARYVDGIRARRQAGSTLKPFLYALAIEQRLLTASSLLNDSPLEIAYPNGIYRVRNYDKIFHGTVPLRTALASSLNVPAVRTAQLVGVEAFHALLGELGFSKLRPASIYGPAIALGTPTVSLLELTNAYRSLVNGGEWSNASLAPGSSRTYRQVINPGAAYIISNILSDRESRALTFGLENALGTSFWSGGKTGTSRDMTDNWCIGFSSQYTVGVWVGNFSGEPMLNVTGISGAAPAWRSMMEWLYGHRQTQVAPSPIPDGVVRRSLPNTRNEYYLAGTEPDPELDRTASEHRPEDLPKILTPPAGALFALDPDIDSMHQQIRFTFTPHLANISQRQLEIEIGTDHYPIQEAILWPMKPGKFRAAIKDRNNGKEIDGRSFEVRGGGR